MRIGKVQYNGVSSDTLGVFVSGSGSYDAAEDDVTNYQVPGRNGDILIPNNRYKNIEVTYPCFIPSDFESRVQAVRNWMRSARSYARIEDNYDLLHYRMGIGKGVLKFSPAQQSIGANAQLVFNCKPQRFLKSGETEQTVTATSFSDTDSVVDFETNVNVNLETAEVQLSPIQDTSGGNPSPTNICPITGHTGVDLTISDTNGSGGTTYSVTFTDQGNQGTVYGGTFDFVSGELTVTHYGMDGGSLTWSKVTGNNYRNFAAAPSTNKPKMVANRATIISSIYKSESSDSAPANGDEYVWIRSPNQIAVKDTSKSSMTENDFKTAMTGVQFVWELATPVTYILTPEEISSLIGQNYAWSSHGNVKIEYTEPFSVNNPTQYDAKPLLKLENPLNGAIINVNSFTLTATTAYTGTVTIDCESQNIYDGDTNLNGNFTVANFPVLQSGSNVITFSDADSLKIVPRWWEL